MLASRAIGCNDRLRRRTWGRRVSNQPVECVVPAGALLGECPVWSEREGLLYWVDIEGRAIHRYDPAKRVDELRSVPGRPGSIALTADPGRLLVAVEHRLAFFDWERDAWAGGFGGGSMFAPAAARRFTGILHRVAPDGTALTMRTKVGVSNGLAFSPDGPTMYWAATARGA